jgi:hypothetical protein
MTVAAVVDAAIGVAHVALGARAFSVRDGLVAFPTEKPHKVNLRRPQLQRNALTADPLNAIPTYC